MKRIVAFIITVGLLVAIVASVDRRLLWETLRGAHAGWFAAALALFVPQGAVIAWRWRRMVSRLAPLEFREAVRMVLAGQAMNLVLPSKLGDLTKALFLQRTGALDLARATQVVVFEKLLDVAALAFWMLLGLLALAFAPGDVRLPAALTPVAMFAAALGACAVGAVAVLYFVPVRRLPFYARLVDALGRRPRLARVHRLLASSHEVMEALVGPGAGRATLVGWSLFLWWLHLAQILLFFLALGCGVPLGAFAAFLPLAIFGGLLPLTIAGIGTRDALLIALFATWHPPAALAGVGFCLSLRYIIPAVSGLPFLGRYMAGTRASRNQKPG